MLPLRQVYKVKQSIVEYLKAAYSVWFYLFYSNNILFYKYDKNGRDKKAY